jgi:hypothetical protein
MFPTLIKVTRSLAELCKALSLCNQKISRSKIFKNKMFTNLQESDIDYAGHLLGQKYIYVNLTDACS